MNTKEMYALAWRYWRCELYEQDCWNQMDEDEQANYDGIDSPHTWNYEQACQMTSEAKAAYIQAGVPDWIMMRAKRHIAQREQTEFTGKKPFIKRGYKWLKDDAKNWVVRE